MYNGFIDRRKLTQLYFAFLFSFVHTNGSGRIPCLSFTRQQWTLPMHHILKYDMIPLNKGNGYSAFDGIFIVPTSGTYVFTWSIMCDVHGSLHTELMRNAEIIGTRFADSFRASVWDFATGIVVVDVNQNDHLYVRLGETSIGIVRSITKVKLPFLI